MKKLVLSLVLSAFALTGLAHADGKYVASKDGDKFHLPTCYLAKNIKTENKVFFNTKADAAKAGYKPCKVCLTKKDDKTAAKDAKTADTKTTDTKTSKKTVTASDKKDDVDVKKDTKK